MTTTNENPPHQAPRPDHPVPDEFDLLCAHCGYSLVGLNRTNRCPECGTEFDPNVLPLARIPWLFRKNRGAISSFIDTLREILLKPRSFAKELCRPIQISAPDARHFRRWVIRIAVITTLAAAALFAASSLQLTFTRGMWRMTSRDQVRFLINVVVMIPVGIFVVNLFFRLMTDLPTFIWRGMHGDPTQLAPVHQYASAPLALLPVMLVPLAAWLGATDWLMLGPIIPLAARCGGLALGAGLVLLLWSIPLRFMKTATGCGWRRVVGLALYLPVHWALMFTLCVLLLGAVAEWLNRGLDLVL